MSKKKIVICDDDPQRSKGWANELTKTKALSDNFEITPLEREESTEIIKSLEKRREYSRENKHFELEGTHFDEADILILDYDLLKLEGEGKSATGDHLAYLSRVFSRAGYIVVLNQFGISNFDLSLVKDAGSRADLNVGSNQLMCSGLWGQQPKGFHPWHWPSLAAAFDQYSARIEELSSGGLNEPILEYLGFDQDITDRMSRTVLSHVMNDDGETNGIDTNFKDFTLYSGTAIDAADAEYIANRSDIIARVAAARVHKWIERQVLVSQDILVDMPHLVQRLPALLSGEASDIHTWNATTSSPPEQVLNEAVLKYRFNATNWASRPLFWWPSIEQDSSIQMLEYDYDKNLSELVFREDVSNFGEEECSREFLAQISSIFDRRYVSDPKKYEPVSERGYLDSVSYTPSIRFAM